MALEFTANGLTVETYDAIYTRLADALRAIYGSDINLDPESPDGQRVAIQAKETLDLQSFLADLYASLDPDLANGMRLESIIKFTGITKRPGLQSSWDLSVTVDRNLTLDTDYVVEDPQGQQWSPASSTALTLAGTPTVVTFKSVLFGAIEGPSSTVITPVTIILGVTGITSPTDATIGIDEETDPQLRLRRNASLEQASVSTVGKMTAALNAIDDVTNVKVYENDTESVNALSMIPHSLWVVIEGGDVADIAETIAKNKTGGTALNGAETETYVETVTLADGSTITIDHAMIFDRPTLTPVTVTVNATRTVTGQTVDVAAIETAIAAVELHIGENLAASRLYAAGYDVGTVNFYLSDLLITGGGSGPTDGVLVADPDEIFTLTAGATITVTEVP